MSSNFHLSTLPSLKHACEPSIKAGAGTSHRFPHLMTFISCFQRPNQHSPTVIIKPMEMNLGVELCKDMRQPQCPRRTRNTYCS